MSQSTLPGQTPHNQDPGDLDPFQTPDQDAVVSPQVVHAGDNRWDDSEFHYKQIPVLAPVTLVLGLASLVVFATELGIIIGVIGSIIGLICFLSTVRNRNEIGGFGLTVAGLALSVGAVVYGTSKLTYDYSTEVPAGFLRTSFANDIAEKGFKYDKSKGIWVIDPDVQKLDGQKIFLKGYMYPTRQKDEITEFILAKDNGQCCFGGQPQVTDMILVKMQKPLAVDFTDRRVSIGGVFHTEHNSSEGLSQVYEIQATHFAVSKTAF